MPNPIKTLFKLFKPAEKLNVEERDHKKAGTRRGPNGSGLDRDTRAKHMTDEELDRKVNSAFSKASRTVGSSYQSMFRSSFGLAKVVGRAHVGSTDVVGGLQACVDYSKVVVDTNQTFKQIDRAMDYQRQRDARNLPNINPFNTNNLDSFSNGFLSKRSSASQTKELEKSLKVAKRVGKEIDKYNDSQSNNICPQLIPLNHSTYQSDVNRALDLDVWLRN